MSTGMLVQCSINESVEKNLTESEVRALQGNQLPGPPPSYKTCFGTRTVVGMSNFYADSSNYTNITFTTCSDPFAWESDVSTLYQSQDDSIITAAPGSCSIAGITGVGVSGVKGYLPTSSYPGGFHCWGSYFISNWYSNWQLNDSSTGNTKTFASWYNFIGGVKTTIMTSELSDPADYSGTYSSVLAAMSAQTLNWSTAAFSVYFNDPNIWRANPDVSSCTNPPYDGSVLVSKTVGSSPVSPAPCVNGWIGGVGNAGNPSVYFGLAKNTTGLPQLYFICHYRGATRDYTGSGGTGYTGVGGTGYPSPFPAGVPFTKYILELISVGFILNNQVIGIGQDIDFPYPSSNPGSFINLGNVLCGADFYFAVIGQDVGTWAAANGLQFGTITGLT